MDFIENHLPDCPPGDSNIPQNLKVFYLVANDPPVHTDFLPRKFKLPNANYSNNVGECQAYGLSVFTNIKGVELIRNSIHKMRNFKIAEALLPLDSGLIKNTPSATSGDSHHTWWVEKNFNPTSVFNISDS